MTENHVSRKLFGGSVCYQLFGKLFGLLSLFFFFPVGFRFFVEEYSHFSIRNVIAFYNKHLLQLCPYLVTFIKFFRRENDTFSPVIFLVNFSKYELR